MIFIPVSEGDIYL